MVPNHHSKRKKWLLLIVFCLIFSTYGQAVGSVVGAEAGSSSHSNTPSIIAFSDVKNHWAEKTLTEWIEAGLVKGYADDTMKPDHTVIRGEAIALINRSFGFSEKTSIDFTDLPVSDWAYEDAAKAVKAGYIQGYADGTIGAKHPISREETAVIIARLLDLDIVTPVEAADGFKDSSLIAKWSKGAVAAVAAANIMEGYGDGSFGPKDSITRAEVIVTLDRALKLRNYNKAGTYGPADGVQSISGDVVVNASGVTLQNMRITGHLLLAEGIAEGDVTLRNVAVSGTTTVKGGGMNSIHLANSMLAAVIVDKTPGTVRIAAEGTTTIAELIVKSPVILDQIGSDNAGAAPFSLVKLADVLPAGSKVTMIGHFDKVNVAAKGIVIEIPQGVINQLTIAEQATDTSLTIGTEARILSLFLDVAVKVLGQGKINKANLSAKAKGATFEKQPLLLEGPGAVTQSYGGGTGGWNYENPQKDEVKIISVVAVNGSISVTMNTYEELMNDDFTIEQIINNNAPLVIAANLTDWDSGTKTALLSVPVVSGAEVEQSVVYRVSFKNAAAVESAAFIVPLIPVIEPNQIKVVENGEARAYIVVATNASQDISKASETLKEYVKKSTGAELQIITKEEVAGSGLASSDLAGIYIGVSKSEDEADHQQLLQNLNSDGFIIDSQEKTITIIGPTSWGTQFGVFEFLERYVGVRWLLPGDDGEDVPQLQDLQVPLETVSDEPAAISRKFFGLDLGSVNGSQLEWGLRNRLHDNIQFHHNMTELFDPTKFTAHPEYYAGGVVPSPGSYAWQPCFNNATALAAIDRIIDFFDENPNELSYSVGINDSSNYCAADTALANGEKNSNGVLNLSNVYYPWVNQIAEGVLAVHPDKYFGLLAYWHMYDPPSAIQLNDHVIPYITDDRMTWTDQTFGISGKEHTELWESKASNLGFYEYLYGSAYLVPRNYVHKMAENYQYANEHGVIGHVAELFPNFAGEGPKPYISAKLQWDPNQDVDLLLNDWYERAVGAAAAPYLKQYYDYWENFWTTRIFDTEWYQKWANSPNRSNYLDLFDASYLKGVTLEDMAESRRLLELVVAHAGGGKQKTRAELILRAFEFYEASVISYPRKGPFTIPANEQDALNMLAEIKESYEMAKKRRVLADEFSGNPILDFSAKLSEWEGPWKGIQKDLITTLQSYVDMEPENGNVRVLFYQALADMNVFIDNLSASAVRTTASKEEILQSLDFSQGPWTDAIPFNDFLAVLTKDETPPAETKVYLLWDDENLYVGYENFDSDLSAMTLSDDAPEGWWRNTFDDSVETYVTGNPEGAFTGFFTNPNAVKFVYNKEPNAGPAPGVDDEWEASAYIGTDRWNTIQVIPFSSIGVNLQETKTLMGYFFRNYHGHAAFMGWGGGMTWKKDDFKPIQLVDPNNLIQNPGFEMADPDNPEVFPLWNRWPAMGFKRTNAFAKEGNYSLEISSEEPAGPYQIIPITPGKYKIVLYYYTPLDSTSPGEIDLSVGGPLPGNGRLFSFSSDKKQLSWTRGEWAKLELIFEIQAEYDGIVPDELILGPVVWGLDSTGKVYIDNMSLHRMKD
ncbi:DUF4838 domain-containing protein [Paenibacillus eucommiae]|uniref:SLH domain-containing protein n=1 Tax=Paenibacillus eucommiae TaxID=1355755 RepID=A0ABS4IZM0_9BACL|nr:DUF4838 domain-containing protein [Paenibacillus eucommiae]MBP1992515.1 hypothetical protein [Paenibacillus eucommiae]